MAAGVGARSPQRGIRLLGTCTQGSSAPRFRPVYRCGAIMARNSLCRGGALGFGQAAGCILSGFRVMPIALNLPPTFAPPPRRNVGTPT